MDPFLQTQVPDLRILSESSDRFTRPFIEASIRQLFDDIAKENWESFEHYFASDAVFVMDFAQSSAIHVGVHEVANILQSGSSANGDQGGGTVIILKLVIVDRGRVTCHVVQFNFPDISEPRFSESEMVAIFDVGSYGRIERMEYRFPRQSQKKTYHGGLDAFEGAIQRAKNTCVFIGHD